MKMTLSTPSTTSSKVSVTSAIRPSAVRNASNIGAVPNVRQVLVAGVGRGLVRRSVAVLTHSSASRSRSTGSPPMMWRLDDFVDVGFGHAAVPDRVRIDDDGRAVLALIEAAGTCWRACGD